MCSRVFRLPAFFALGRIHVNGHVHACARARASACVFVCTFNAQPHTFASASSAAANSSSKDKSSLYWSKSQGREEVASSLALPNSPAA